MSALIEAARKALEALETCTSGDYSTGHVIHPYHDEAKCFAAEDALRTALAAAEAQPVGEPFGYVITNNVPESSPYRHVFYRPSEISAAYKDNALYSTPVYTAPPAQPAAQPLTDEQISALVLETVYENDERIPYRDYWVREIGMPFARAIEAAHGIGSQP